jgi:enterochelin esterase-like enzyme
MRKRRFFSSGYPLLILLALACFNLNSLAQRAQNSDTSRYFVDSFYSSSLKENRKFSVYLPAGYNKSKKYPVIYASDGQILETGGYRASIDSLIAKKIIPPLVMIGAYSNERAIPGDFLEYRNYEYVKSMHSKADSLLNERYQQHLDFFVDELMPYCEGKYSVSKKQKDKIFYGFSNGAALGVTAGLEEGGLFNNYILCSIAGITNSLEQYFNSTVINKKQSFHYYIAFGKKEPDFEINSFKEYLDKKHISYDLVLYEGGHERVQWKHYFIEFLSSIYQSKNK